MSRSGYHDDGDIDWYWVMWRGAVLSAINGRRGQAFLRELRDALEAMPDKRLIANDMEADGSVCAIGALGRTRGIDMSVIDPEDIETVADRFGISKALAKETVYMNDEAIYWEETPEQRYSRMLEWVRSNIVEQTT